MPSADNNTTTNNNNENFPEKKANHIGIKLEAETLPDHSPPRQWRALMAVPTLIKDTRGVSAEVSTRHFLCDWRYDAWASYEYVCGLLACTGTSIGHLIAQLRFSDGMSNRIARENIRYCMVMLVRIFVIAWVCS